MKRRLFALFLAVLLILPMALPASAETVDEDELNEETVKRVYQEVLSGNITNEEDVLKVALAQYANRAQAETYAARSGSTAPESSASIDGKAIPTVTQVLETKTDDNGVVTKLIANTGLHVTDANGNTVYQDKLYIQDTWSLNYNITATHTVYFYYEYSEITSFENYVTFDHMVTTLFYGSYKPTLLKQYYCVDENYIPVQYLENTVTNPVSGMRYQCTSSHAKPELSTDHPYPGFSTWVLITCNGVEQELIIDVNSLYGMDYTGTW